MLVCGSSPLQDLDAMYSQAPEPTLRFPPGLWPPLPPRYVISERCHGVGWMSWMEHDGTVNHPIPSISIHSIASTCLGTRFCHKVSEESRLQSLEWLQGPSTVEGRHSSMGG